MRLASALVAIATAAGATSTGAQDAPPKLDCAVGFDGLRAAVQTLPGAKLSQDGPFDLVTLGVPEVWKADIAFTTPLHAAHPAITQRTFIKQVTGVWTAQSKVCGYGNSVAFEELTISMKAGDTALTNASRDEVERAKQERSPLAP